MAISVARVHLKVAHAALPALLPTPPKWNMLPLLSTPPCVAAVLPKPSRRTDSGERWDAHKTKAATSASSSPRSTSGADSVRSCAGHGSSRKSTTSPTPPLKPSRADSVERWDAHKKQAASPASSSGSCNKWPISRASSTERWDVHKKHCPPLDDDGESSSTSSKDIDIDIDIEEEIVWKPWDMYAGPGFAAAAPEPSMIPMPTVFLLPVA